jgi:tetratricopeptide (TPR) repeat protein
MAHAKAEMEKQDYARAILDLRNATRLLPKDAEPYYLLGLAYLATGEVQTAVKALLRATEIDPKHAAAQTKLAELMSASHDPMVLQDAADRLRSIATLAPENSDALSTLAVVEYALGKPEDAEAHLDAAVGKSPGNLKAARGLALVKFKRGDFAAAEAILKKAVVQSPHSAEAEWSLGQMYLMGKRAGDAERAFRRALAIDPKYAPAWLGLLGVQVSGGRLDDAEQTMQSISALGDPQYRAWHAMFQLERGKTDAALAELEKFVKDDPNDRASRARLIQSYMLVRRFPDAERAIQAGLKKNDKDVDVLIERSKLYLLTAKVTEAQSDLNQVLRFRPESAEAHYLLSKVHQARGEELARRQELGLALKGDFNLTAARVELAQSLILAKSAKAALDLLERAPEPNSLPVIVARNRALFALEDLPSLRKSIDEGLTIRRLPELVLQDGYYKLRRKDLAGARKSFQEVLAAIPDEPRAVDALGKTYSEERKDAVALQTVREYAAKQAGSARLQYVLGVWMLKSKQPAEARKAFAAAVAADPMLVAARIQLAELDIADGNLGSAMQVLGAAASTPNGRGPAELILGMLAENRENPSVAIAHYRKVLEVDPNNVLALNNLSYHLANDTDQLGEALKYAQQAQERAPDTAFVSDTAGWVFYRNGLFPTAVKLLERSVSKEPTAQRKYHLAMAYFKAGDPARAEKMLEQAYKMDPKLPEAAAAQQLISPAAAR